MDADKLNKWLTLGANLGVLVGILFLAVELKQNNELLQAQAEFNYFQNRLTHTESLRVSPEYGDLLAKMDSGEDLSPSEQIRADAYHINTFLRWQYEFAGIQAGRLQIDEHFYEIWRRVSRGESVIPAPGCRGGWERQKHVLSPEFVEFMEAKIIQ